MAETLQAIGSLALAHGITSYDAAYVELAKRRSMAVATLDQGLQNVCAAEGVNVLD